MNLSVKKYPFTGCMALCKQIGDSTVVEDGAVLMTEEEYNAWVAMPEQVAFMDNIYSAKLAADEAAANALKAKQDAQIAQLIPMFGEELARKIVLSSF